MKKLLSLVFILAIISTVFASIDYNMIYDADGMGYDEANGKYRVKLQIKSNGGDVPLGYFNLRILFNEACLAYNDAESYSTGPIEDFVFYGTDVYTLVTALMSNIKVGVNGVYDGLPNSPLLCYNLGDTWTDCAVFVFDVVNTSATTNLRWDISGVQNQITIYDTTPVDNGTFYGNHDISLGGTGPVPPAQGYLYFSEISDNLPTQDPSTAFIEIKNVKADEVSLAGVTVTKVDATTPYVVNLSGAVPAYGAVIITNGADQAAFETAWNTTLDMNTTIFVQGDAQLMIGDGYGYALDIPDVRATIDNSPVVNNNERVIQTVPNNWTAPTTPDDADPGLDSQEQSLPVEFAVFNVAAVNNKFVNITWSTKSETDLLGFRLLRCENDDLSNAIPLNANNLIEAHNSSETKEYQHVDNEVEEGSTYYYWIEVVQADNNTGGFHGPQAVTVGQKAPDFYDTTALTGNYPNPFNPKTTIKYSIKGVEGSMVKASLVVYNIKGQKVKTLFEEAEATKDGEIIWNGKDDNKNDVSSGVYFYKLQTPDYTKTSKMVLLK